MASHTVKGHQLISKDDCKRLIDLAISSAGTRVDGTEVEVTGSDDATSRFANNGMTQNQAPVVVTVSVRVLKGHRQIRLSTDDISDEGIKRLVDNAITAVNLLQEDKTILPLPDATLTKQTHLESFSRFDTQTAITTANERADSVKAMIDVAKAQKLSSAGVFASGSNVLALGNSNGLFLFHDETSAECSVTISAPDSSGWDKVHNTKRSEINSRAMAEHATKNALLSAHPRDVDPGRYTVILPPSAVLDLVCFMWGDFSATSHIDKLSSLLGKVGQKVFGDNINVKDDVYHPLQAGRPFDGEGLPRSVVTLVENGVVKNLVYGRRSAAKMGAHPTGHGLSEPSATGEYPMNIVMQGGNSSIDEMVSRTDHGILLSRVWYVRLVDPTTVLLTGMTRDGTFMIEGGKISHGIKNLRFNVSVIDMLNNVLALGPSVRAAGEQGFPAVVPALKIANFNFSSTTKF